MKISFQRAADIAETAGYLIGPVPRRVLIPILEYSSLEDDDTLRTKWATLLANDASKPNQTQNEFVRSGYLTASHRLAWDRRRRAHRAGYFVPSSEENQIGKPTTPCGHSCCGGKPAWRTELGTELLFPAFSQEFSLTPGLVTSGVIVLIHGSEVGRQLEGLFG